MAHSVSAEDHPRGASKKDTHHAKMRKILQLVSKKLRNTHSSWPTSKMISQWNIDRLGQFRRFVGRFSRLFLDYFQVKFRLFLDGLVKN
jgi:hypothetical protein